MIDSNTTPSEKTENQNVDNSRENKPIVDAKTYLFSTGFTFGELSIWLAIGMPVLYLLIAIIEGSSYIWRPIAIFLYIILLFLGIFLIYGIAKSPSDITQKRGLFELDFTLTLLGSIAVIVGFSQLCRHLFLMAGGFVSQQTGYWHWLRFGFSNLFESALFDIPAIYEWNLSEIKATSVWSRTIVFAFRTTIEFLVVVMILVKQSWHGKTDRAL